MKLTAKELKALQQLQPAVAVEVEALKARWRTRRVNYEQHADGWRCYLGEGEQYTFYAPNGKTLATQMVSENTIGAANDGVNYHVGQQTPPMPEGTWAVQFDLFLGRPYITVHYVGVKALAV